MLKNGSVLRIFPILASVNICTSKKPEPKRKEIVKTRVGFFHG